MQLVKETRVRGSVIEFTFKHKVKRVEKQIIVSAINVQNAMFKAWKDVSKQYKELKKQRENGLQQVR